jgi:hypothetical protein
MDSEEESFFNILYTLQYYIIKNYKIVIKLIIIL